MLMENSSQSIMMKQKLDTLQVLKQALKIPFKNPSFILLLFLTWLPLIAFTIIYEMIYQHTILETAKILVDHHDKMFPDFGFFCFDCLPIGTFDGLISMVTSKFVLLFLLYLGILHLLDLINIIYVVDSASIIHSQEKIMNLKEIISRLCTETRFKGPLITSAYSLFLVSLVLSGLISLAIHSFICSEYLLFMGLFGCLFIALLVKYIEWIVVWNMAAVVSVLDEKQGDVAFVISSYLSRDSRRQGVLYSLIFSIWILISRLAYIYVGGTGIMAAAIHSFVLCFGNTMKWLVFTVYYYDCQKRSQEKLINIGIGIGIGIV